MAKGKGRARDAAFDRSIASSPLELLHLKASASFPEYRACGPHVVHHHALGLQVALSGHELFVRDRLGVARKGDGGESGGELADEDEIEDEIEEVAGGGALVRVRVSEGLGKAASPTLPVVPHTLDPPPPLPPAPSPPPTQVPGVVVEVGGLAVGGRAVAAAFSAREEGGGAAEGGAEGGAVAAEEVVLLTRTRTQTRTRTLTRR